MIQRPASITFSMALLLACAISNGQTSPQPTNAISPSAVAFTYMVGQHNAVLVQQVTVEGDPTAWFTADVEPTSAVTWLSLSDSNGQVGSTLMLTADPTVLGPGKYTTAITITFSDGVPKQIALPVTLTVSSSSSIPKTLIPFVQSVQHGASVSPTAAAPGQIVSIIGRNLGPDVGVSASPTIAGAFHADLGGVRVLFDGIPAALLFVSRQQINAVVPYRIAGRASVSVQVEYDKDVSNTIQLKVPESNPGIFTSTPNGRGQAAALNVDMTPNSIRNPASRGTIISVWATGEGQTDPSGQDGRVIITDLRKPLLPVSARIGGIPARVIYAGSAPDLLSGVSQINIEIPFDVPQGSVPIEIQIGAAVSQAGVTVAIR